MVANSLPSIRRITALAISWVISCVLAGCMHAQTVTNRVTIVPSADSSFSGLQFQTGGAKISSPSSILTLTGSTSTNGDIYLIPSNVAAQSSVYVLATRLDTPSFAVRDASGTTTGNSLELQTNAGTVYFKVIGGTDAGAPGTVVTKDVVPFLDNTYKLGNTTHRYNAFINDITIYGTCTGCSGTSLPVVDTTSIVYGSSDATKLLRFEVDGFTTATTRVLTPQNQSYTVAGLDATGQVFTTINQILVSAGSLSGIIQLRNSSTSGISGPELYDSSGALKGWVGYSNSASVLSPSSVLVGAFTTNPIAFATNSTERWNIDTSGNFLPSVNNTVTVGSASFRPSKVSTVDLDISGTCTGCSSLPVVDTTAIVKGSSDATKLLRFEVDGFTTATTRVLTPQDQSYTVAGLDATGQVYTTISQILVNAGSLSGVVQFRNSNTGGISGPELYNSSGSLKGWLGYSNSASSVSPSTVIVGAFTTDPIAFVTNSTERFRIDPSGWLLGGITSTDLSISSGAIITSETIASVTASTNASVGSFKAIASNYVALSSSRSGAGTYLPLSFFTSGTRQWDIDTNGNFIPQTTNDIGASGSRVDNGYFTNINISGTCTGCSALPVVDTTAIVKGSSDATKLLRFEVDGFTTATTRVLTPQNQDYTVAGLDATGQVFTTVNQILVSAGSSGVVQHRNSSASGLSGPEIYNSSGALKGWLGYANGSFSFAPSSMAIAAYTTDPITFSTNSTERFRVDASGWLLGALTSTDLTISPGAIVTSQLFASVTAATNASVGSFKTVSSNYLSINSGHTGSGTDLPIAFFTAGVEAFRITNAGNMLGGITSTDVSVGVGAVITNRSFVSVTGTTNASLGSFQAIASNYFAISSSRTGSGTYLPIAFFTNATRQWDINTSGGLIPIGGGDLGSSGSRVATGYFSNLNVSGTISSILSVRDAGGGSDCTITVTGGFITASTC